MKFIIQGGRALSGEVRIRGAKNAATKMMIASLLTDEPVVLDNFPIIGDTDITAELCEGLGSHISVDKKAHRLSIHTPKMIGHRAPDLTRRNRIPILALGPLLARKGKAFVPVMGGDKIGPRPVDLHIAALTALGARVKETRDGFEASAPKGLSGANITFRFPSVGATENAMLAAVLAKGRTVIENAAMEPEVLDVIQLLQKMGAIIGMGAGRMIYIDGVDQLNGAKHTILPDRNEAISFAVLGVATGGSVMLKGIGQQHLITFLNTLRKIGAGFTIKDDSITFFKEGDLVSTEIETDTHPGFMTDWQQPMAVLLTQANGSSIIHETIYEDRFGYAQDLNGMGADIHVLKSCLGKPCRFYRNGFYHSALIKGPSKLKGAKLRVRDLRSGMAHVVAALVAKGESEIDGVDEIDRGYERLDERIRALGGNIERSVS